MEHNRKQKLLMIIALVVGIASLSIGFAAFATTLNISSSASVTPNSDAFSVKFSTSRDSLVTGSVIPSENQYNLNVSNGVIINSSSPIISGLSVTFTEPGQSVAFDVYVRNEGQYTAYLNNITSLGEKTCQGEPGTNKELVQSACYDINRVINVEGLGGVEGAITNYPLEPGNAILISIVFEYSSMGTRVDGDFLVSFPDVALVYSTIDDSSMQPTISGKKVRLQSGDLNTPGSIVSIGDEKFYVYGQENGNVKLLSMYNLYVGNIVDSSRNVTALTNPTGIQHEDAIGSIFDVVNKVFNYPWVGTTAFSSDIQKGTDYSDYEGSIVEGYVNNYKSYLAGLGVNIEEARLITKEELEDLGCDGYEETCEGAPDFLYNTSYWTGTKEDSVHIWYVYHGGYFFFDYDEYDRNDGLGVRPVIIISTSEF